MTYEDDKDFIEWGSVVLEAMSHVLSGLRGITTPKYKMIDNQDGTYDIIIPFYKTIETRSIIVNIKTTCQDSTELSNDRETLSHSLLNTQKTEEAPGSTSMEPQP